MTIPYLAVPMPGRGGIPDMVEESMRPTGSANGAGQDESAVRKDFPETWLWTDITAGYTNLPIECST